MIMDYKKKLALAKEALDSGSYDKETIEYIFPELKESEDEKIRKDIIVYLQYSMAFDKSFLDKKYNWSQKDCSKWIAWLEKQGEQNPAWSEGDEEIYYGVIETEQYMLDVVNGRRKFDVGNISIKEECTRELNWLKSLKDRIQPQQEWSEKDSPYYDDICEILTNLLHSKTANVNKDAIQKDLDWLISLEDRYTWKPSDEQMKALWEMYYGGEAQASLATLYSDLKNLRKD